ncbi:MAG TPA: GEVED domain-containing protein, partial [Dokdonella sp.]
MRSLLKAVLASVIATGGLAVSGAAFAFPEPYCTRAFTNAVEPITHVALFNIDNTTGAAVGGTPADEDFTAIVGNLHPGSTYAVSMSGNSDGNFTNYYRLYVDWNHDGVFNEDASERYEIGSIVNSTGVDGKSVASPLLIPLDALTGQTRMRAVKKYNDPGAACSGTDASGTSYGQAEDYTVNVDPALIPPPTMTKAFAPTNADASLPSTLTISLGANASATPLTLTADLVDTFPAGMTVATTPNASTSCSAATLTAASGAGSVTLASGAQIPPAGCSISVDVQVAAAAVYVNTIPAGSLQTNGGSYAAAVSATYQATSPGVVNYSSGFESPFTIGGINGQQGWAARSVNVANTTPANGAQHLSITSTASPSTSNYALAISPDQAAGTTAYALISANVRMTRTTNGANWRFNPQDTPAGLVTSILQFERSVVQKIQIAHFAPDGSATLVDTGATWPASTYFNIKLIVERATGALKICKDNVEIYNDPSGDSVAGTDITDVAVSQLSGSGNTAGNTFFADDLVIDNTNIGSCNGLATPAVAKSFAPASVVVDTDSMATITLSNPNAAAITLSADLVDTLPAGLVASAASTTCGGTASFTAGTLTLASGATIPPGSCTLTATVQAATADSYVNTIHAGDLQTGAGTNAADALATLTVTDVVLLAPTVAKSFAPASVAVDTDSTATITLTNPNATAITLSADLVDVLPAGLVASAAATTCGGTASFTAGTLTLAAGATIPAGSSCTLSGTVQAAAAGSDINTIDVGDLQTSAGSNAAAASATLTVTGGGSNGVYHSPQLNHAVVNSTDGTSLNLVLGTFDDTGPISGEWDLNFWASGGALRFWSVSTHSNRLVVSGTTIAALHPGDTVGPSSTFQTSSGSGTPAAEWLAGTNAYAGVKFNCDGRLTHPVPATVCYGYVHITSTGAAGFPATVVEYSYDGDGNAITIPAAALVAPTVAKVFAPASVVVNANSTATITLSNPNAAAITLSADLVDTLPAGLVASAAATTCGGTASFTAGTLTLASGATIPPGSCTLSGTVQAAAAGGYDNTIHAGDLQTNAGNNAADALATLTVTTSVVTHTVTPSVGTPSGSVAPATVQTVNDGATTTFTLTADPGFHIDGVGGTCGGALAGIVYTTAAVTTDCTVVANFAADGGSNGIILSGPLGHAVADSVAGTSLNIVTSAFDDTGPTSGDWDFNFWDNSGFAFYTLAEHSTQYVVDGTGNAVVMQPGDVVGPGSVFSTQTGNGTVTAAAGWLAGTDGYAGVKFDCDGRLTHPVVGTVCYGYVHITTTGTTGFPATIVDTAFDGDGNAITIVGGSTGNDPAATVAPTSLAFTVVADATATDTLNIANAAGSNALTYSIASSGSTAKRPLLVPHVAGLSKGRVGNARPQDADKLRYLEQLRQQPLASFAARGGLSSSRTPAPWSPRAADGAITFVADDGTYETAIGLNNGVATSGAVYVNRFSATDALTVDSISILWPSSSGVTTGMQPNLVVYYDAAATGDITNAVRLGVDQIVSIDSLDAFQTYTTSFSVPGAGDVYIGFVDEWGLVVGGFNGLVSAAALDVDSPSVTYVSGSSDNTLVTDIINLANNDLTGAGSDFGLDGAWLVRATGAAGGGAPCTGPVVSWLTAAPASGSVAGGSNVDVTVTANPAAGGLAAGSYTAELCVTTNDPDQPLISVPVSLTVTPATVLPCSAADTVFCNGFEGASGGGDVVTGTINQAVVQDDNGSSFDFASGDYHGYSPSISSDDINLYFLADPAPPVNP